jgi:uncharacterized membrane protein required for colicin V production
MYKVRKKWINESLKKFLRTIGFWVTYIINLLVVATIMLASALILAVAKEMQWFPDSWIRHASKELARKRTSV